MPTAWRCSIRAQRHPSSLPSSRTDVLHVIATLVASLDLPGRLRDAEVPRDILPTIAEESMRDMWIPTNPRAIKSPADVMPLLEAAW